jgi:hypothetical protein
LFAKIAAVSRELIWRNKGGQHAELSALAINYLKK